MTDRTVKVLYPHSSPQAADRYERLRRDWLPMTKRTPTEIAAISDDRDTFLATMGGDIGLFTRALVQLPRLLEVNHVIQDPLQVMSGLERAERHRLLQLTTSPFPPHSLSKAGASQARQYQCAVAARSAVTSILAQQSEESARELSVGASAVAALRQLGWMLVAFNYYDTFRSAMRVPEALRDSVVKERIGLSPRALSLAFARECRLPLELCRAVVAAPEENGGDLTTHERQMISVQLLGQLYAESLHPATFPSAAARFERACDDFVSEGNRLDRSELSQSVGEQVSRYFEDLTAGGRNALPPALRESLPQPTRVIVDLAPQLSRCNEELREAALSVSQQCRPGEVSIAAVESFISQAVPRGGFCGGCLYLLDPDGVRLRPVLRFGSCRASGPLDSRLSGLVPQSLYGSSPAIERSETTEGVVHGQCAGAITPGARDGVLLLEFVEGDDSLIDHLAHFKVLRDCLEFSLGRIPHAGRSKGAFSR